jgi:hypothetical protein
MSLGLRAAVGLLLTAFLVNVRCPVVNPAKALLRSRVWWRLARTKPVVQ